MQVAAAAVISGTAKFIGGASLAGVISGAVTAAAISGAGYIINKATQGKVSPETLSQNVMQSAAARRVIYGERRVGGTIVHIGRSDSNKYIHLFVALAGHEVESISDIWLNDNPLSHYNTYGKKASATITWLDHDTTGKAESYYDDYFEVTVNSVAYSGSIDELVSALQTAGFDASGDFFYEQSHGDETGGSYMSAALEISAKSLDDVLTVSASNGTIRTNQSKEFPVIVRTHLGTADQTADTDAVSELDEWTTDHRLQGIAYVYVRLRYEFSAFPNGIPTVTALVKGKNDIYDPRTETSGYSVNSALCVADYIASDKFGYGAEYDTEINNDFLIAAANICDEQILLNDDETYENRYECHGVIDTSTAPKTNIEGLLSSMAGTAVLSGGLWFIRAGAYEAPTISLDENDLRSGLTIQTKLSRTDICNRVKGTFISEADDLYQETDFPSVTNATYLAEDNNEPIWKDIAFDFTTSEAAAQRLAKIALEQSRQGITIQATWSLAAFPLVASDTVMVSNTRMGWEDKVFRVTEWAFIISDDGELLIDMTLRETASNIFDWADGEETTSDAAPNTSLADPWSISAISGLTVVESTYTDDSGDVVPGLTASWDEITDSVVSHYRADLYLSTGGNRLEYRETVDSTVTEVDFYGLSANRTYMVVVHAVNRFNEGYGSVKICYVSGVPVSVDWDDVTDNSGTKPEDNADVTADNITFTLQDWDMEREDALYWVNGSKSTDQVYAGTYSLKIDAPENTAGYTFPGQGGKLLIPVTPGQNVSASCQCYTDIPEADQVALALIFVKADKSTILWTNADGARGYHSGTEGWELLEAYGTVPDDYCYMSIRLGSYTSHSAGSMYFDNVRINTALIDADKTDYDAIQADAQTRADAAQAAAEAASDSYGSASAAYASAQAYADAAQAAAETTAAAYADGIVSTEEARAIADATAKADAAQLAAIAYTESWSDEGATVGATWNTNITDQPADALILNSEQTFNDLDGSPEYFRVTSLGYQSTTHPTGRGLRDLGAETTLIAMATRGYCVSVYDRTAQTWDSHTTYDTYGSATNAGTMAAALNALSSDKIVVIHTWDEPQKNRLANGLDSAMYRCGASRAIFGSDNFKDHSAYILIGIPGVGEGNGLELYSGDGATDVDSWVETVISIYAGNVQLGGISARNAVDISYADGTLVEDLQPASAGADVTDYDDYRVSNSSSSDGVTTIANPQGGTYSSNSGAVVGAIVITLPKTWSNTMLKMMIDVYLHSDSASFSVGVGGYTKIATTEWLETFAQITGNTESNNRVRFGHDGSNCCVVIGEITSTWAFPKIKVRDFQAGHNDYAISSWYSGWSCTISDDLTGYTFTQDISDTLLDAKSILGQGVLATEDTVGTSLIDDYAVTGSYSDTLATTTELSYLSTTEVAGVTVDGVIDNGTKILITASAQVYFDGDVTTPIQVYLKINGAFWLSEGGTGGITDTCKGVIVGSSGANTTTLSVAFIAETFIGSDTEITADITTYVTDDSYVSAGAVLTITELKK